MDGPSLYLERHGGPARQRLAALVAAAKSTDPLAPVTVVVPTTYAGLSLRRSLAAEAGLLNVRFMVPARLAEHLGAPTMAARGKAPLTPLAELAALRASAHVMARRPPLGDVAHHPRLHEALRRTFRELATLPAADLRRLEQSDALRAQTVEWFQRWGEGLSHYYDREELARAAALAVADGGAESALRDLGFIVFFLVQDLSPAEMGLVASLGAARRCNLVLGLTGEEEADHAARLLASRLEPSLGAAHDPGPAAHPEHPPAHQVVSAPDAHEEVRWVLRHVALRAEEGLPFHRMAILYRQPDPYAHLVSGQLRLAGIPVAGPDPRPLKDTPAGKLLSHLYSVVQSDFSRESVLRWVAEAPVKGAEGTPASAELARWEVVSRKAGVVEGVASWQQKLNRYGDQVRHELQGAEDIEETSPAKLLGLRGQITAAERLNSFVQVLASRAQPPVPVGWRACADWAKGLLRDYAFNVGGWPEEHRDSYERVMAKLDDIAGLEGLAPPSDLDGFWRALDDALGQSSGRLGEFGSGVFLAHVGSAQGMEFETVYLVGMAEGSFPPTVPEDPLLPDRVRRALVSDHAASARQAGSAEERRAYLGALASGRERVLTYPRADHTAERGQLPSPWVLEAAEEHAGGPVLSADLARRSAEGWLTVVQSQEHGLEYGALLAPADLHDYDLASVARWRAGGRPLGEHFLSAPEGTLHRSLCAEASRRGPAFTTWDGRLSALVGKSRRLALPSEGVLSPTRLERWATCPFRYFLGDVLELSALESPEELIAITALQRGVLVHRVLERFVAGVMERGPLPGYGAPWTGAHLDALMQAADHAFQEAEAQEMTGRPLLWSVAKEEIREDLATFLEEDSRWRAGQRSRPASVEQRFGFGGVDSLPAVELALPDGTRLRFRGVIDRVDATEDGAEAMVIDYKSGSSSSFQDMRRDALGAGRHLQLPVYGMALRSGAAPPHAVTAQYWFVSAREGFRREAVSLSEVEGRFRDILGTIASGIGRGLFPANPGRSQERGKFENCRNCDFDRVCPSDRDILWSRKRLAPELAGYDRLAQATEAAL